MDNPFKILIGEKLSSVVFVMDYLQLDFDGNRITAYEWPIVKVSNNFYQISNPEYRNILCSIIAKNVIETNLIEEKELRIIFEDSSQVIIDIQHPNPEAIYFVDQKGGWSSY